MSDRVDKLLVGASEVVTCAGHSGAPARRNAEFEVLRDAAVAISGAHIARVGPEADLRADYPDAQCFDVERGVIAPGFVDCHTHLVFAGSRADEWEARMLGKPYLQILQEGGGILTTVAATRAASQSELLALARKRLHECVRFGTTTIEIKSGYCLDDEGEFKLLRVAKALADAGPAKVATTYLGAHVVPAEHRENRGRYIADVERAMRRIAAERLAEFVDVFCESEAFTLDETTALLSLGRELGLGIKLHTEQFTRTGGTSLAAQLGAVSVDHLEMVNDDDVQALANSKTIGVLLPGVPFHLNLSVYPPARRLLDAGAAVALATDLNPGSSFTPSMPMILALACRKLHMSVAEAWLSATINGAHALGRAQSVGSLEPGKQADLLVLDIPEHRHAAYGFGNNPVAGVMIDGEFIRGIH